MSFHMRDVSMSRPCERRDPSVSAIALIAAARTLVSALEQRPFFSLLRPGVMGPCVRRDDPLRDCARPRPYQPTLSLVICDSPALAGEG